MIWGREVGVVDLCCFLAGGYAAYRDKQQWAGGQQFRSGEW